MLSEGKLWPDPLLQFNPAYEQAGSVKDIAQTGLLHHAMPDIFKGYFLSASAALVSQGRVRAAAGYLRLSAIQAGLGTRKRTATAAPQPGAEQQKK